MTLLIFALTPALLIVALGCFRISEWHQSESNYWNRIALLVRFNPSLDVIHRPDLDWAKAEHPSLLVRLRGWQEPPERRRASQAREALHTPDDRANEED